MNSTLKLEYEILLHEYQAYLDNPSFRGFSQFKRYDHQYRVRLAEQRLDYLERVLYPTPTRAEVKRAEIALESTLEDSLQHIQKKLGPPAGSCWWFR